MTLHDITPRFTSEIERVRWLVNKRDAMHREFSERREHLRDIADFILPHREAISERDGNRGAKKGSKIDDSHATAALRVVAAGLMSGLTNPSEPWFELGSPSPLLDRRPRVRRWLQRSTRTVRDIFTRSNLYDSLPKVYLDERGFGTSAMTAEERPGGNLHTFVHPIGSYRVQDDADGRAILFYTRLDLAWDQLVAMFGMDALPEKLKQRRAASGAASRKGGGGTTGVHQLIYPNDEFVEGALDSKFKRFRQTFWLDGSGRGRKGGDGAGLADAHILRESGFDEFPVVMARAERIGNDSYGFGGGMDALPPTRQLQAVTRAELNAINTMARPPIEAPGEMENIGVRTLPGFVNYRPKGKGGDTMQVRSLYDIRFDVNAVEAKIANLKAEIDAAFGRDLFQLIGESAAGQRTATEVLELAAERDAVLAPLLESLSNDLLDPLVEIGFGIANRNGLIEEPPPELANRPLRIRYISVIARAQQARKARPIQALIDFAAQSAQVFPNVLDRVDIDEAFEEMADALGSPQSMVRDRDEAERDRAERARQLAAQAQAEQAQAAVATARDASQVDTAALTDFARSITNPAAA